MAQSAHWRVILIWPCWPSVPACTALPMYALIQLRAKPSHRARIIAANKHPERLFMIVSSLAAGAFAGRWIFHS